MKNLLYFLLIAIVFFGCASKKDMQIQNYFSISKDFKILNFENKKMNLKVKLASNDDFKSAILSSNLNSKIYNLSKKPSDEGIYLEDINGTNIHFTKDYALVEFKKFNSIILDEVK